MDTVEEPGHDDLPDTPEGAEFAVGQRVRVYPGTSNEQSGRIVDDFGPAAGNSVDIGDVHIADPSRRWAVILDDGSLVFVNTSDIGQ